MLRSLALLALLAPAASLTSSYTVDGSVLGPRLDGFGAISGGGATSRLLFSYPPAVLADILDLLFLPSYGASLHHLKVEVGGDGQSSEGVEPSHLHTDDAGAANFHRGYEFQLAKAARARNPAILLSALPWTWPGGVGAGTHSPWTDTNKSVTYLISWLEGARDVHNLTFNFVNAGWNERGWSAAFVLALRAALDARGFAYIGLVCGDDARAFSCAQEVAAQPALRSALVALGSHGPQGPNPPTSGLPLWDTEVHVTDPGGTDLAAMWTQLYLQQNVSSGTLWNVVSAYNPGLFSPDWGIFRAWWPWCGFYQPLGKLWVFAHHTQATAPGMHWLPPGAGAGALLSGGTYASFLHPATGALTLIINKPLLNASAEAVSFSLQHLPLGAPAELYAVRSTVVAGAAAPQLEDYFVLQPSVPVFAANATTAPLRIAPGELWTLTSLPGALRKGAPPRAVAQPSPFPLFYSDTFAACPLGSEAPYFTDMTGSFECAPAAPGGSSAVALVQSVPQHPIAWRPEEQRPFSLFAADISLSAVNASIAFWLPTPGSAVLLGARANPNNCCGRVITGEDLMPGAWVAVCSSQWGLYNAIANVSAACGGVPGVGGCLAVGSVAGGVALGTWHTLALSVSAGGRASAALNGGAVPLFEGADVGSSTGVPARGFVGIGTGDWGQSVQFQDFVYSAGDGGGSGA
jgi:galactosylceramidase